MSTYAFLQPWSAVDMYLIVLQHETVDIIQKSSSILLRELGWKWPKAFNEKYSNNPTHSKVMHLSFLVVCMQILQ